MTKKAAHGERLVTETSGKLRREPGIVEACKATGPRGQTGMNDALAEAAELLKRFITG